MPIENGDKVKLEYMQKDIEKLAKSYKVLNDHSSSLTTDQREIKTDVAWLKKAFWIVASASIGGLVSSLIQLLNK